MPRKKTFEEFKEEIKDLGNNEYVIAEYTNSATKIDFFS